MFAREEDALMIPVIGTCSWVVEVGVIPSMVLGDGAATWFVPIASSVGESTISTFVPVQQAGRSAPVARGPFSFFLFGGEMIRSCPVGEAQTWPLRTSNESWSDSRRRFRGAKLFVDFGPSCVGSVLLLDEVPSFEVYLLLSLFETSLPLVEVSKLPLELNEA
jgi:hypothetical protein